MTDPIQIFVFGCLGGVFIEVYRVYKIREDKTSPPYYKQLKYWIATSSMILSGGFLSWLYNTEIDLNPLLVINIGITAPHYYLF